MPYIVQPMTLDDVDQVAMVERECFTTPWPKTAYIREIKENRLGHYIVVRWVPEEPAGETAPPAPEGAGEAPLGTIRRLVQQFLRPFGLAERPAGDRRGELLGFAGMWVMLDEAHITTICVRQAARGRGLGELLLASLIELAMELGCRRVTLEVRVSNTVAQNLYRKYGFRIEGVRRHYYSDNGEDAYIMWSEPLDDPAFQQRFQALKAHLAEKLAKAPPPVVPTSGERG